MLNNLNAPITSYAPSSPNLVQQPNPMQDKYGQLASILGQGGGGQPGGGGQDIGSMLIPGMPSEVTSQLVPGMPGGQTDFLSMLLCHPSFKTNKRPVSRVLPEIDDAR
jgi:hypothetical protein